MVAAVGEYGNRQWSMDKKQLIAYLVDGFPYIHLNRANDRLISVACDAGAISFRHEW